MHRVNRTYLLAACSGLLAAAVSADVVTLTAVSDTSIYSESTDRSNGAGEYLVAGRTGPVIIPNGLRRALIAFDIASAVPAHAVITHVTLRLALAVAASGGPSRVEMALHRVASDWGEGASDAGNRPGLGAPAGAGDATWLSTFYPGTPWTLPGGDYSPAASATASIGKDPIVYAWTSLQLAEDVQAWYELPAANHGWILLGDETTESTGRRFHARETTDFDAIPPTLEIHYEPIPEPSVIGLVSAGLLGFAFRARRR